MAILPLMRPNHLVKTLENGLLAIAIERPAASTALLAIDVRAGARFEAPSESGLSHFLEHMVFQGCQGFPTPAAVNDAAERMGAALDASTSRDVTHFEHLVAPDRLADSATLLASLLSRPAFESIEPERAIILEEALDELDEDGRIVDADTLSRRALWPDCALGQSVIGEQERLATFSREELVSFHQRFYGAANMVLTVVGPQPPEALLNQVQGPFSALPRGVRHEPVGPTKPLAGPILQFVDDTRSQCDCRVLFRAPGQLHPDATATWLLRLTLDDGLASRLQLRLGGELGLAYDQWAAWEHYVDAGAFELGAQVSPAKVPLFVQEALAVAKTLITNPPEGEELERVRFRALWSLRSTLDSAEGVASLMGSRRLYDDQPADPERLMERLARISPAQLAEVAARIFDPTQLVVCVVGPAKKAERRAVRAIIAKLGGTVDED